MSDDIDNDEIVELEDFEFDSYYLDLDPEENFNASDLRTTASE